VAKINEAMKFEKRHCLGLFLVSLFLLSLTILVFPHYSIYSRKGMIFLFILSTFGIICSFVWSIFIVKIYDASRFYQVMDDNKLVKINYLTVVTTLGLIIIIFSLNFFLSVNDFWGVLLIGICIAFFPLIIQYHKGIIKLIKKE